MARRTEVLAVEAGTLRERTAAQAEPIAELRAQRELHNASERATQAAPAVIGALAPREPATDTLCPLRGAGSDSVPHSWDTDSHMPPAHRFRPLHAGAACGAVRGRTASSTVPRVLGPLARPGEGRRRRAPLPPGGEHRGAAGGHPLVAPTNSYGMSGTSGGAAWAAADGERVRRARGPVGARAVPRPPAHRQRGAAAPGPGQLSHARPPGPTAPRAGPADADTPRSARPRRLGQAAGCAQRAHPRVRPRSGGAPGPGAG